MCQLRRIIAKTGRNNRVRKPRFPSGRSEIFFNIGAPAPDPHEGASTLTGAQSRFTIAMPNRNKTRNQRTEHSANLHCLDRRDAGMQTPLAAIAIDPAMTIVEWPNENISPTAASRLPSGISCGVADVIDGRNMVGIHSVTEAEAVCQKRLPSSTG